MELGATPLILMVDADKNMLRHNRTTLEQRGYSVTTAETLASARKRLNSKSVDLIVLDSQLPDGSGLDFCLEIRKQTNAPILILSSSCEEKDIVEALLIGADDYMTKSRKMDELHARVVALLRRSSMGKHQAVKYIIGNIEINLKKRCVSLSGNDVQLKEREYAVFVTLLENRDRVMTADELLKLHWLSSDSERGVGTLRVHLSSLRRKLKTSKLNSPLTIVNVYNRGYQLQIQDDQRIVIV